MADQRNGGIAWTDETWNPVRGCSRVSEGCRNCYAEDMAARFSGAGQPYEGTVNQETKRWNGNVRLVPEKLADPLRWARPRMVFVNSMSDLFHESVPDEFIDQVFAVMALAKQHTFQVLTKRPERMLKYLTTPTDSGITSVRVGLEALSICLHSKIKNNASEIGKGVLLQASDINPGAPKNWPLPNVWMGVTVENQETADERIPLLLQTPAAVRWLSMEPLLGAVDLKHGEWIPPQGGGSKVNLFRPWETPLPSLDWVVVGGESGINARPMHPDWPRALREQCADAGVPILFKQWGEFAPWEQLVATTTTLRAHAKEYVFTDGTKVERFGKRLTGRALDGYEYNGYPEARP